MKRLRWWLKPGVHETPAMRYFTPVQRWERFARSFMEAAELGTLSLRGAIEAAWR